MANIFGIEVSGDTYDLEDSQARQDLQTAESDIDGIEGKIPSSASTSNRLLTKDDLPQPQIKSDVNITLNAQSTATTAKFGNVIQYGNIVLATVSIDNLANSNLGSTVSVVIGSCDLRPLKETSAILLDYSTMIPIRLYISTTGNVTIAESTGLVSGNNHIRGELTLIVQ